MVGTPKDSRRVWHTGPEKLLDDDDDVGDRDDGKSELNDKVVADDVSPVVVAVVFLDDAHRVLDDDRRVRCDVDRARAPVLPGPLHLSRRVPLAHFPHPRSLPPLLLLLLLLCLLHRLRRPPSPARSTRAPPVRPTTMVEYVSRVQM